MFGFGALITNLFTELGKATVGGLRPYFITICKPNITLLNCSQGYITEDVCTGDPKDVLEARSVNYPGEGGGMYFLIKGYWGYASGWGRIFMTQLTIMGSPF